MDSELRTRHLTVETRFPRDKQARRLTFAGAASNCVRFGGTDGIFLGRGRSHQAVAKLQWTGEGYVLLCELSRAVILVNGESLNASALVGSGDTIRIGSQDYHITIGSETLITGNRRQVPEEESWSALYEGLKRICRQCGLMGGHNNS